MYFSRSLLASAALLSFSSIAEAGVAQRKAESDHVKEKKSDYRSSLEKWSLRNIFKKRQNYHDLDCSPDIYQGILSDNPNSRAQTFCNILLEIPPATTEVVTTPTITVTTSSNGTTTITSTTRVMTTETVVETATMTPAPAVRRAANAAARIAVGNDVFSSIITSGTETSTPAVSETNEAIRGMSNACSCRNVDPTSTNTVTFTAPNVQTTMPRFVLRFQTDMVTTSYTTTTTVTQGFNTSASSTESLGAAAASNSSETNSSSTASVTPTFITSGVIAPTAAALPIGTGTPVVVAIPFSCPKDDKKHVQVIAGGDGYDYAVFCDTGIDTANTILTTTVGSETDCAAVCSLFNADSQEDLCQAATYTPASGAGGGSCLISGPTLSYVHVPGSVTLVHTGTFSSSDNCVPVDQPLGSSNRTIDTSALAASITSASFSVSTPGFVTRSETGGEFRTFVSSGYTDASGWYHYSWYELYASSSAWYEVYATAWTCTANIPRTVIVQNPEATAAANVTSVITEVTTIINGATTTIISGTSTSTFTNGNGLIPPTGVVASTTSAGIAFTTAFSTAYETSYGSGGIVSPSARLSGGNESAYASEGSGAFTTAGAFSTFNSTGSGGAIPPTAQAESSISLSSNGTAIASSGGAEATNIGGTFTSFSTGGSGIIPPMPSNGSLAVTISGATATSNSTGGVGGYGPQSSGAAAFTASGEAATANSTGSGGIIPPTGVISAGSLGLTLSGAVATSNATYGSGVIPPSPTANETAVAVLSSGAAQATSAGNTSIFFSTGGAGSESPVPITLNSTQLLSASSGALTVSTSGRFYTANSTGGGGIISPSPVVGGGNFTIFVATTVTVATGASGVISPTPSANASSSAGTGLFSTAGTTAIFSSIGGSGVIPPPSTNVSETVAPLGTGSISSGSLNVSFSGATAVSLSTGGSGAIPPAANSTTIPPPSLTPTPSSNITTEIPFSDSDANRSGRFSRTTNSTAPIGTGTSPPLVVNSTAQPATEQPSFSAPGGYGGNVTSTLGTEVPSVTIPPVSVNASITLSPNTTGDIFTNTDDNRFGRYSRSLSGNVTLWPGTQPTESASGFAPAAFTNSTGIPATPTAPLNGTSQEACPVSTQYSLTTRIAVITTTIVESVPVAPSSCISSESAVATGNATLLLPTYPSSTAGAIPTSAAEAFSRYRRANEIATQEQVDAACADQGNIVFNGEFNLETDNNAFGWTSAPDDSFISFSTYPDPERNGSVARVRSAAAGRAITISQPLTLCPNKQYRLSAYNKQDNLLARCTIAYSIGNNQVFTTSPQESWLTRGEFYTAGATPTDVSQDLKIRVTCAGEGGAPVGTDEAGYMAAEFDDVRVTQV